VPVIGGAQRLDNMYAQPVCIDVKSTLRLDDDLLAATKHLAAQTGRTLTAVIEDALREALMRRRLKKRQGRFDFRR